MWLPRPLRMFCIRREVVLRKLDRLYEQGRLTMATIDDAAQSIKDKITALTAKVDETVVTLGELKALIGTANTANAEAILAEAGATVDAALANLTTAETDADPTPDA
jgi:ABC-type hemin transport system substrate-binding protein